MPAKHPARRHPVGKASGGETSGTVRLAVLERGVEIGQAEITVRQEKEIKQVISQEIKA